MKALLNERGKELVLVKERIINKEIPVDIVPIVLSKYPVLIQIRLEDDEVLMDNFIESIKEYPEYLLTKSEIADINNKDIHSKYEKELSLTNSKYTIKVENDILTVDKYFRIGKLYYKNFIGVDLNELLNDYLRDKKDNKNSWMYVRDRQKSSSERRYETELENYNTFVKNRLHIVLGLLQKSVYDNEIIPEYKNIKDNSLKPMRVLGKIEKEVATVSLKINLNKKDNFESNVKSIRKFLDFIENEIERHMLYSIYK